MITIYSIIFLLVGLIIGSFLNVVIFRIDDLKTIIYSRSRCQNCKKEISWYDLIPLLSFILLQGKCRNCGSKISFQYPLVELFTGLLFMVLYLFFGLSAGLIFYLIIFSLLVVIFVYDLKTQTVPEVFVWIVFALSLLGGWYYGGFGIPSMLIGGLISGGFLLLLAVLSKEKWMGYGDIKLGFILGFLTGYPAAVFGIFFAFVLGSVVGLIYIAISKKTIKAAIPFAPFIILAILYSLTYGQLFINWYFTLIKIY